MADNFNTQWIDTLRAAGRYPSDPAERVVPDDEQPNVDYLGDPNIRVYDEDLHTVLAAAIPHMGDNRILIVVETQAGTLESPKTQSTPDAVLLRTSNLHTSWGVKPNTNAEFDPMWMYSPRFSIFKSPDGLQLSKPMQVASLTVKFPRSPSTMYDNNVSIYQNNTDMVRSKFIIDGIFRVASARGHNVVVFCGAGIRAGHPAGQIAQIVTSSMAAAHVPICLFAMGMGSHTRSDPEYVEFYEATR